MKHNCESNHTVQHNLFISLKYNRPSSTFFGFILQLYSFTSYGGVEFIRNMDEQVDF